MKKWKNNYDKCKYSTMDRLPFFKLAGEHLPQDKKSIIVDIGAGDGGFADCLELGRLYKNLFMLDGNLGTVSKLEEHYKNAVFYRAPNKLPFKNASVNYIHSSHLIEHLTPNDFYDFLVEIDRVLVKGGVIVFSTPMLWDGFYNDLTHVKPYNPEAILHYLSGNNVNITKEAISKYEVTDLKYRYTVCDDYLNSDIKIIDLFLYFCGLFKKRVLKIKKYKQNGYTLILRKL